MIILVSCFQDGTKTMCIATRGKRDKPQWRRLWNSIAPRGRSYDWLDRESPDYAESADAWFLIEMFSEAESVDECKMLLKPFAAFSDCPAVDQGAEDCS